MDATRGIYFDELSATPADFIRDFTDPELVRRPRLSFASAQALRRQQVDRLQGSIVHLRRKQEEFNRKMEEYIQSIRALVASLEGSLVKEPPPAEAAGQGQVRGETQVRCLTCGAEKVFGGLQVIVAKESLDSITQPTELIVDDGGTIKKGTFRCSRCGNQNLQIKDLAARA